MYQEVFEIEFLRETETVYRSEALRMLRDPEFTVRCVCVCVCVCVLLLSCVVCVCLCMCIHVMSTVCMCGCVYVC